MINYAYDDAGQVHQGKFLAVAYGANVQAIRTKELRFISSTVYLI